MSTDVQQGRNRHFTSPGVNRPLEAAVIRHSKVEWVRTIDPTAAEVMAHLRKARVGLERLAIDQSCLTHGSAFTHFEEASRSVHSALIELEECTEALGASGRLHDEGPRPYASWSE